MHLRQEVAYLIMRQDVQVPFSSVNPLQVEQFCISVISEQFIQILLSQVKLEHREH